MPTGKELISQAQQSIAHTSAEEVHRTVRAGQGLVILDVREKEEWDEGHIPGAVHLARGRIEGRIEDMVPDKTKPIVCHWGGTGRSSLAAKTLKELGYTNVSYMDPGFSGWKEAGFPFETDS